MTSTMLDFSKPHVLRNEAEYMAALEEANRLLDKGVEEDTEEHDYLGFLFLLIEGYERDHESPLPEGTPQSVVEFMLGQKEMSRADLAEVMGGRSRVSDFFSGKRVLSRRQIEGIRDLLGVPADLLL